MSLRRALCPTGETVIVGDRPIHVVAWAKKFLFQEEQLEIPVGKLSPAASRPASASPN